MGTKIITEDVAHLIIAQVLFFFSPIHKSITLSIFPSSCCHIFAET